MPPPENSLNLEMLYDTYGAAVYRLALRMLGNASDAEDLTQEVFVDFWRKQQYDATRGSLLTFLLTMTRSRSLNRLRQKQSKENLRQRWATVMPLSHADRGLEQAVLSEWTQQLQEAFQALPQAQAQVLEMTYYEDLSQSEIAERLSVPLGTVKTRSRQGLIKLRKILQPLMEEPNSRQSEQRLSEQRNG